MAFSLSKFFAGAAGAMSVGILEEWKSRIYQMREEALMKVRQDYQSVERQKDREYDEGVRAEERDYASGVRAEDREYDAEVRRTEREEDAPLRAAQVRSAEADAAYREAMTRGDIAPRGSNPKYSQERSVNEMGETVYGDWVNTSDPSDRRPSGSAPGGDDTRSKIAALGIEPTEEIVAAFERGDKAAFNRLVTDAIGGRDQERGPQVEPEEPGTTGIVGKALKMFESEPEPDVEPYNPGEERQQDTGRLGREMGAAGEAISGTLGAVGSSNALQAAMQENAATGRVSPGTLQRLEGSLPQLSGPDRQRAESLLREYGYGR